MITVNNRRIELGVKYNIKQANANMKQVAKIAVFCATTQSCLAKMLHLLIKTTTKLTSKTNKKTNYALLKLS